MSLSIIVPTIGRASLFNSLASLVSQPLLPGDEVLVIGGEAAAVEPFATFGVRHVPCPMGRHWGCEERTLGFTHATQSHLAFLDDDDVWVPGARAAIDRAVAMFPERPILFQMRYASGRVLWATPELKVANVSTQMIVIPNVPAKLGRWSIRREGDFHFLASMKWPASDIVWRDEVIAEIGAER